ncbi:MAG: methionine--tRNA ligase [Clostridia bacterium]|nr:methionine--tRNA ligase [Clostridia bacterium]
MKYQNKKGEKYYLTTAIAYASQKPHFGNVYEIIMTDALARFKRQIGYDVFFLTGTDEHGQKIEALAEKAGISPKEYVDNISDIIKGVWNKMNISYDKFIRTTDDYHEKAVQNIFRRLYEQGDIYKGHYEGWYCEPDEAFFTDTQVVDGKCPDCGRPVQRAKEEAYFLRMSAYADKLMKYIEDHPDFIEPESRKKEMVNNFLSVGLQDLCVSRSSFKWGVPVTFDDKHVIYVWIDALSNYFTAVGYDPDNEVQPDSYKKLWPADVHIIGKDILRFHTIYWPIILMALGEPLPKKVFGHPWFNYGIDKMSKSRGNVIYADILADKIGVDGVRHYALAEMPYASDGSITYESVVTRYNTDLANNLGNLVSRTLAMTAKYFGSVIPENNTVDPLDEELISAAYTAFDEVYENMETFHISDAVESVFNMLRRANKYIDETAPWVLAKDEASRGRLGTVLYNLLETIRYAAILLYPIMPDTSDKILDLIGTDARNYDSLEKFGALTVGNVVKPQEVLFNRIDEKEFMEKIEAEKKAAIAEEEKPAAIEKPEGVAQIGIEDFMGVELRTAQILACEAVPKAKKLLKLEIDLGYEKRQVVSGIAKFYKPEDLIGKKIIVVANLKPAVLCGIESNGMILASGEEEVRVVFLSEDTPLGERVR